MLLSFSNGPVSNVDMIPKDYSWEELFKRLSQVRPGEKNGSYLLRGGVFTEPKRAEENLLEGELLILDADARIDIETGEVIKGAPPIEVAKSALDRLQFKYIIHTSFSYDPTSEYWRYRIFIPAKLRSKKELAAAVKMVIAQLHAEGCYIDDVPENSDWARAWFLPRCKPEFVDAFRCYASLVGKDVDVEKAIALVKRETEAQEAVRKAQEAPTPPRVDHTQDSVIKEFNRRSDLGYVRQTLESMGYKFAGKKGDTFRYIAPTSESGTPGVIVFKGKEGDWCLYSHHGAHDPLSHRLTDPFRLYAIQQHGGDLKKASRKLWDTANAANAAAGRKADDLSDFDIVEGEDADPFADARQSKPKAAAGPAQQDRKPISANAFVLVPEDQIPPRQWVYGRHLIRRFVSATVAPGGVGKSSITFVEAMAMATGKPLLGVPVKRPLKVWVWCLEDPREELDRRFTAIAKHYQLTADDIDGRLYLNSGRDTPLCVARQETRTGTIIIEPDMAEMEAEITRLGIDVVTVDPFVASHMVSENDNVAINTVMRQWVLLAERCNIAIELVHHTRKNGDGEITAETSRGAKALTDATRDTRVINQMSEAEGARFGVENRRLHVRTYSDKANLAPPADQSDWYELKNVVLNNGTEDMPGDHVGVATRWEVPGPFAKVSRETIHALLTAIDIGVINGDGQQTGVPYSPTKQGRSNARWVGQVIMDITAMEEPEAKRAIDAWVASGVLVVADFEHGRKAVKGVSVNKAAWSEMVGDANVR
jgi:hypothetical protein